MKEAALSLTACGPEQAITPNAWKFVRKGTWRDEVACRSKGTSRADNWPSWEKRPQFELSREIHENRGSTLDIRPEIVRRTRTGHSAQEVII